MAEAGPGKTLGGQAALVTGAGRRIGRAIALRLAAEGARVAVHYGHSKDQASAVVAEIHAAGGEAFSVQAELTRIDDIARLFGEAERRFGGLDILVNNAGIANMKGVAETSEEEWDAVVNINQKGVWLGMKSAIPAMRKRGSGSIINISSIYGLIGSGGAAAYHGTKGAVRLLTKAAAVQYAPENIRVNSVHPGVIKTPMVDALDEEQIKQITAMAPMKRAGTAEEVGYVVLFLASNEASFVTGSEYVVDGGYTAV
jgi:cyclopentanol dehydrogenase